MEAAREVKSEPLVQDAGRETPIAIVEDNPVAAPKSPPSLPAGANGPRDAVGMIGESGEVVSGTVESTLLVNSAP